MKKGFGGSLDRASPRTGAFGTCCVRHPPASVSTVFPECAGEARTPGRHWLRWFLS